MHKLLIVDDSEACRKPFRTVGQDIEGNPFLEVVEAETGEDGLAYFKEHLDIVYAVVDVHLPGINGFTMLKRMNEFDHERFLKLRVFMSCTEACEHEEGEDHGHGDEHSHGHEDEHSHKHSHADPPANSDQVSTSWLVKPINPEKFNNFLLEDYKKRT